MLIVIVDNEHLKTEVNSLTNVLWLVVCCFYIVAGIALYLL